MHPASQPLQPTCQTLDWMRQLPRALSHAQRRTLVLVPGPPPPPTPCPLLRVGQDECIFKQFLMSNRAWTVEGYRGLRKKTEGQGVMISGFVDELRGFGLPMTTDELQRVDVERRARYGEDTLPLKASPGVYFLEYGKNKDGYWTVVDAAKQLEVCVDCYECVYPGYQIDFKFDYSSGHTAHRDGCLCALKMNVGYGGKQPIPHASRMTEACLGPVDKRKLNPGDMQYFFFRDRDETGTGRPDPPPWYAPHLRPEEYVGKAKGMKQVLWERGLWKEGMVGSIDEDDERDQSFSMTYVLSECEDFRNEVTLLEEIAWRRGHIVSFTPKGHCELAGVGIEYCWGKMKRHYRNNNDPGGKVDFHKLVVDSMRREVLPPATAMRFARKARAYERAYRTGESNSHASLESMVKTFKTHRNALDFAGKFIDSS